MSISVTFYRNNVAAEIIIVTTKPDSSSNITKKMLGDSVASLSFSLPAKYNFNIGDYTDILGEMYFLTEPPVINKKSKYLYEYSLKLETLQHKLRHAQMLFYGADNTLSESDFSLTGTTNDFANILVLNAKRVYAGWTKGGVINSSYKTLTFSNENCLSALAKIAAAFETEFFISGNSINIAKRQNLTSSTLTYGRGRGLFSIDRQLAETNLITRLYVYGGNQNLPNGYRNFSQRLLMDSLDKCLVSDLLATVTPVDGFPQNLYRLDFVLPTSPDIINLKLEWRKAGTSDAWDSETSVTLQNFWELTLDEYVEGYEFKFTSLGGSCNLQVTETVIVIDTITNFLLPRKSILENNISKHGLIEGALIVDDIFPQRESTVTATDVTSVYKFKDTSLEFDVNDNLVPGISAKVVFNTGQLAGYKFEISKFNNSTKEFTILKNKDEKALDLPSAGFKPSIGDKYILLDIYLPQAYVTEAEKKLRVKATEYLALKSEPVYKYVVACDPKYFRAQNIVLEIGDLVHLQDIELEVDKDIRIVSLTRSLIDEFEYSIDLSDVVPTSQLQNIQAAIISNGSTAQATNQQLNNNALFNGTYIGTFNIEQGTVKIKDMETASDLTGMKALYIDADGKVWKAP